MFSMKKEKSLIYQKIKIFPLFEEIFNIFLELLNQGCRSVINLFLKDRY